MRFEMIPSSAFFCFVANSLSDLERLQVQCASCRLSISLGWPPFAIGMIWSMQGDRGCGYLQEKSTGFPQMPHTVWLAYIRFFARSKARRCVPSLSGRLRLLSANLFASLSNPHSHPPVSSVPAHQIND